jgi:hypothetical protein
MRTAIVAMMMLSMASVSSAVQKVEPCKRVPCVPPATFTYKATRPPVNTILVRYGGETKFPPKYWLWIKAGEPATPCTAAQKAAQSTAAECAAKIGDPLFITMPFTLTE